MNTRPHPDDLERNGRSLVAVAGAKAGRSIGGGIWRDWREKGYHPSARELAAFLRGYSAPLGGWLPEGMAEYLADRLQGKHPKPKGGRLPPTRFERMMRRSREGQEGRRVAEAVFLAWEAHREAGTPYPQKAAFQEVADRELLYELDVKKMFYQHREGAVENMEAWLDGRAPLSPEETALMERIVSRERDGAESED